MLLVAFAGVLLAVLLRHCALGLARHTPLAVGAAIAVVVPALLGTFSPFLAAEGPRIVAELAKLARSLPDAVDAVQEALSTVEEAFPRIHASGELRIEARGGPERGAHVQLAVQHVMLLRGQRWQAIGPPPRGASPRRRQIPSASDTGSHDLSL